MSVIGLIACVTPVVWSSGSAAAASATVTSFRYWSFPGDFVGGGSHNTYTAANARIGAGGTAGHFTISVNTSTEQWIGEFSARLGTRLHTGWYPSATRSPDTTHPGLSFFGDGRGCNNDFGGFIISSIQFDTGGNLTELSMEFHQRCESPTAPLLLGWFNYNAPSSAPVTLVAQDPSVVRGEPVTLGARVASTGTPPTGSVTFIDGTTPLGTVPLNLSVFGLAHINLTTLAPGTHAIHADYSGDANYSPSSSNTIIQIVSPATTDFWFASNAGDYIGAGALASFADPNVSVVGGPQSISISTGSPSFDALIYPPSGGTLQAGGTYSTTRFPDSTHAGLDFFGDGRGCNNSYGSLVIHRLQTDSSGNLTAFNANFVQHCEQPTAAPLGGKIVLNG